MRTTRLTPPAPAAPPPPPESPPPIKITGRPGDTPGAPPRPVDPSRRGPKYLAFHPDRLVVVGDKVLPSPAMMKLEAGLSGVVRLRNGGYDVAGMVENAAISGRMLVFPDEFDWIREVRPGLWLAHWESEGSRGEIVVDEAAAWRFVEVLMHQNRAPKPDKPGLAKFSSTIGLQLSHLETQAQTPTTAEVVAKMRRDLGVVRKAIAELDGGV